MVSPETLLYIPLAILAVAVLWGVCEIHLLRHKLDGTHDRARRRQQLSPHLFDQEQHDA